MWDSCEQPGTSQALVLQTDGTHCSDLTNVHRDWDELKEPTSLTARLYPTSVNRFINLKVYANMNFVKCFRRTSLAGPCSRKLL